MDDLIARAHIIINASDDKVWDALVNPVAIKAYLFGTHVVSDWKEGSAIEWSGEWKGQRYVDKGKIMKIKPGQLLSYTHYSPLSGVEDVPSNYHTVTVELSKEGSTTKVALMQDNNKNAQEKEHSEQNWKLALEAMKNYVEK